MDGTILNKKYDIVGRIEALEEGGGELPPEVIVENDVAYQFSATSGYFAGDFVYKDGTLYKFEVDHEAGPWNSEEVYAVRICDSIISEFGDGLQRSGNEVFVKLKNDGGLHFDENGAIYAEHLPDYRLTEYDTKQQWIDGKPIYSKTLRIQNSVMSSNKITVDISNLNVDKCFIDFTGSCAYDSDTHNWMSLNFIPLHANVSYSVCAYIESIVDGTKTLVISSGFNYGSRLTDIYVTLRYTKNSQLSKKKTNK